MSRQTKERIRSLSETIMKLLEEVMEEERVTKEAQTKVEDQEGIDLIFPKGNVITMDN